MLVQIFASSACTGVVCTIGAPKTLEQLGGELAGALADAADDARQRVDLLEELPAAIRSGAWATNTSSPTRKPRCFSR